VILQKKKPLETLNRFHIMNQCTFIVTHSNQTRSRV